MSESFTYSPPIQRASFNGRPSDLLTKTGRNSMGQPGSLALAITWMNVMSRAVSA